MRYAARVVVILLLFGVLSVLPNPLLLLVIALLAASLWDSP